jgi:hypothetical protein
MGIGRGIGSGGGGTLVVEDEGILVTAACTTLNFVGGHAGATLQAIEVSPGIVDVYHPAPALPPFFSASGVPTQSRRISWPTAELNPYSLGAGWSGGDFRNVLDYNQMGVDATLPSAVQPDIRHQSPGVCRFINQTSTIDVQVTIYDSGATGDQVFTHSHGPISGNGSTTNVEGNITVTISSWAAISSVWQAQVRVDCDLLDMLLDIADGRTGSFRYSITITHTDGDTNPSFTQSNVFYDNQPIRGTEVAALNDPPGPTEPISMAEGPVVTTWPLSGIYYYDLGSQFDVQVYDLDYVNADTSPDVQAQLNAWNSYGLPSPLNIRCTDVGPLPNGIMTGWVTSNYHWNEQSQQYQKQNWAITRGGGSDDWRNFSMPAAGPAGPAPWPPQAQTEGHVIDWVVGPSLYSPVENLLIDTSIPESSDLEEYFSDEVFRRTSADAAWDSTQNILVYDGGSNAQVIDGKLIAPFLDFSGCNPQRPGPALQFDYSVAGAGPFHWYRRFTDTTESVRTSAVFTISGFTLQNLIDEDIRMWIYIPGKWTSPCFAHGPLTYNSLTFNADNDPIRTNASIPPSTVAVSFGTPLTGLGPAPDNYFIMHLEIVDTTIRPSSIVVSW